LTKALLIIIFLEIVVIPMSINAEEQIEKSLQELLGERFVHDLSGLIYNSISTLWHIDRECEKHLSHITARVISALFCLECLSHIDTLLKKKLRIKNLTDRNLAYSKNMEELKERLSKEKGLIELAKEVLPHLRGLVDSIEAGTLEKVTQIAHTGDYLLSSLDDMRSSNHPDYHMWLHAIPYYYEKDLLFLSETSPAGFKNRHIKKSWEKQIPIEPLDVKKEPANYRINLNTHHATEDGFFPCTSRRNPKVRSNNR
jgi:hypothetical protein